MRDYDMSVLYHPSKANVLVDVLIHLTMGSVSHINESKKHLVREVHRLPRFGVRFEVFPNGGAIFHHNSE